MTTDAKIADLLREVARRIRFGSTFTISDAGHVENAAARIEALEAEVLHLRALVESAYREGVLSVQWEYDEAVQRMWIASKARRALDAKGGWVMALKVYGWTGWRDECPCAANGSRQTREIVAAKSRAEASRLYGRKISRDRCSITGNEREVRIAMARPGTVLWRPLADYKAPYLEATP